MTISSKIAGTAAMVVSMVTLSPEGAAAAGTTECDRTVTVASKAGTHWSTKTEQGRAVALTPHPAWASIGGADWIWRTPSTLNEVVTFKRAFKILHCARHLRGYLRITADNAYRAYLNGKQVGAGGPFSFDGPDESTYVTTYTHPAPLRRGWNVLKVEALNYFGPVTEDNPAGVVFRLDARYSCPR